MRHKALSLLLTLGLLSPALADIANPRDAVLSAVAQRERDGEVLWRVVSPDRENYYYSAYANGNFYTEHRGDRTGTVAPSNDGTVADGYQMFKTMFVPATHTYYAGIDHAVSLKRTWAAPTMLCYQPEYLGLLPIPQWAFATEVKAWLSGPDWHWISLTDRGDAVEVRAEVTLMQTGRRSIVLQLKKAEPHYLLMESCFEVSDPTVAIGQAVKSARSTSTYDERGRLARVVFDSARERLVRQGNGTFVVQPAPGVDAPKYTVDFLWWLPLQEPSDLLQRFDVVPGTWMVTSPSVSLRWDGHDWVEPNRLAEHVDLADFERRRAAFDELLPEPRLTPATWSALTAEVRDQPDRWQEYLLLAAQFQGYTAEQVAQLAARLSTAQAQVAQGQAAGAVFDRLLGR